MASDKIMDCVGIICDELESQEYYQKWLDRLKDEYADTIHMIKNERICGGKILHLVKHLRFIVSEQKMAERNLNTIKAVKEEFGSNFNNILTTVATKLTAPEEEYIPRSAYWERVHQQTA